MAIKIQIRRDTAANWTANNPVLAQGEPALETDTGFIKWGNGVTAWNSLGYATGVPSLTGNAGKYLTTDGSTTSWASVEASINPFFLSGM